MDNAGVREPVWQTEMRARRGIYTSRRRTADITGVPVTFSTNEKNTNKAQEAQKRFLELYVCCNMLERVCWDQMTKTLIQQEEYVFGPVALLPPALWATDMVGLVGGVCVCVCVTRDADYVMRNFSYEIYQMLNLQIVVSVLNLQVRPRK